MTLLLLFLVVPAVVGLLWGRRRLVRWLTVKPPEMTSSVIDSADDPLLGTLELLSRRITLAEQINETLRKIIRVLVPVVAVQLGALLIIGALFLELKHTQDRQASETTARRIAFCLSLDDQGRAAEAAADGSAEAALKTFLDPAFQTPGKEPTPQAVIDLFVQKYRDNTKDSVHTAVQAQVVAQRVKNGFSPDCTSVAQPPKAGG